MSLILIEVCPICSKASVYTHSADRLREGSILKGTPLDVVCLSCVTAGRYDGTIIDDE